MAGILASMSDTRPIGIFDSGVGGLTVLHELHTRLPAERLTYLADLAHFPYGPRYQQEVRDFALRIIDHLVGLDTKLVVVACNTATAAALNIARERFDVPVVGVIAPGAQAAVEATRNGRVAVISTEGTRASQEYVHAIKEANPGVGVLGIAVPELVDVIEAGEAGGPRAEAVVGGVIDEVTGWGADTLVLGCTHYPLLRPTIERVLDGRPLTVVDSARDHRGACGAHPRRQPARGAGRAVARTRAAGHRGAPPVQRHRRAALRRHGCPSPPWWTCGPASTSSGRPR